MNWGIALLAGIAVCLGVGGCGSAQLDTRGEGNPNRVVAGSVELGDAGPLPAGAALSVRVLDPVQTTYRSPTAVLGEPSTVTPALELPPKVVAEAVFKDVQGSSIPFRLPYYATDEQLRHGLVLEARISFDGKVRFYNVNSYGLTLGNADDPHRIYVNPVSR